MTSIQSFQSNQIKRTKKINGVTFLKTISVEAVFEMSFRLSVLKINQN